MVAIVCKFLTYCFNGKEISQDPFILKYIEKLQSKNIPLEKQTPYKKDIFTVWKATGFRFYDSSFCSFAILTFGDILVACCMVDNRVHYWYFRNYEYRHCYDNFMFHPKYPVLANIVYNLYQESLESPYLLPFILNPQPWKLFASHQIFSPNCILGPTLQKTNLFTLELCISSYGEYDEENFTNIELVSLKPWDVQTGEEYDFYKFVLYYTNWQWRKLEEFLCNFDSTKIIFLEQLLCDIRFPFEDEGYKFIFISLNLNNIDLYKWAVNKYSLSKKRLIYMLDYFPQNDVAKLIKQH